MSITSKSQLRSTIRDAETAVALLRSPRFRLNDEHLETRLANLLEDLANVARRAFPEPAIRQLGDRR